MPTLLELPSSLVSRPVEPEESSEPIVDVEDASSVELDVSLVVERVSLVELDAAVSLVVEAVSLVELELSVSIIVSEDVGEVSLVEPMWVAIEVEETSLAPGSVKQAPSTSVPRVQVETQSVRMERV